MFIHQSDIIRFEKKYTRLGPDECWPWQAGMNCKYGQFMFRFHDGSGRNTQGAHVFAYMLATNAEIPKGMMVLHICNNPSCVNPRHLEIGIQKRNMQYCVDSGRHFMARKTHCKRGHEFTPENTYISKIGGRSCLICRELHKQKRKRPWLFMKMRVL